MEQDVDFVRHLDFDIDRDSNFHYVQFETSVQFILLHMSALNIGKFRLRYTIFPDDWDMEGRVSARLASWVSAAIKRNVVELDLKILVLPDDHEEIRDLPPRLPSIFCCKTLKVLKLWIQEIKIPEHPSTSAGCFFPSLKIFHLTAVDCHERLGNLLCYFPVLEDLSINVQVKYSCDSLENIDVKVCAPELKTLKLSMESSEYKYYDWIYYYDEFPEVFRFCVDAPELENLEILQIPSSNYILENPKSVVNAIVAFECLDEEDWPSLPDRVYQLLTGISNVKCLSLSDQPIKASHLPAVFGNLNQLRLDLRNRNSWEFLTELLQKTPNLEDLDLVLEDGLVYEYGTEDEVLVLEWNPPEVVPDCLSSNLKTISIRRFKGLQAEIKLAKYMLLNGFHLSKMKIYICMLEKEEACKDLYDLSQSNDLSSGIQGNVTP